MKYCQCFHSIPQESQIISSGIRPQSAVLNSSSGIIADDNLQPNLEEEGGGG